MQRQPVQSKLTGDRPFPPIEEFRSCGQGEACRGAPSGLTPFEPSSSDQHAATHECIAAGVQSKDLFGDQKVGADRSHEQVATVGAMIESAGGVAGDRLRGPALVPAPCGEADNFLASQGHFEACTRPDVRGPEGLVDGPFFGRGVVGKIRDEFRPLGKIHRSESGQERIFRVPLAVGTPWGRPRAVGHGREGVLQANGVGNRRDLAGDKK